jgi:hypothetical protein
MDNSLIFELNLRRLEGFATPPSTSQNPIWPQQHHNFGNLTLFSAYLGHFLFFLEFSDFSEHFEKNLTFLVFRQGSWPSRTPARDSACLSYEV